MQIIENPFPDTSRLTFAVVVMIIIVFVYTTGKLMTSPTQVGLGTVVKEYAPLCFWSLIAYRLLKYDCLMMEYQAGYE